MKKIIRKSLFTLLLGIVLTVPTAFAETDEQAFNRAVAAVESGDYQTALPILQRLAILGYGASQYNLGIMYLNGYGVKQNHAQAAIWITKAAKQGIDRAQFSLGRMYYIGEGVPQNYQQAIEWFHKAVDQGNIDAAMMVGTMYALGQGVEQDIWMAKTYFLLVCTAGNNKDACKFHEELSKQGD